MKKAALVLTVIFMFFVLLAIGVALAKSIPKTLTVPDDYDSIQEALDNAESGDTVFVKKGVYVENPVVRKPVALVGEDRNETVINVTAGLKVESDGVSITGFTIYDGHYGISLSSNYCDISGNKITNATHGLVVFGYENSISDNIFESIGLSSAIQLNFANRNIITGNYIAACVEGIQIWQNSSSNTIAENTITNCRNHAVSFQYSDHNALIRNNISNSECGTSIYVSNNNSITNNNYVNNTIQFSANEWYALTWGDNRSINTLERNYWSNYNGTDTDGNGIGDVPYVVDENNQDDYPLMNPVSITRKPTNRYPKESPHSLPSIEPTSITIKPDGSVDPISTPIVHVGETYRIEDNLYNASLVVERNNIVIDGQGFTLLGRGFKADGSVAIKLSCTNVSVANMQISGWEVGILGVFDNNTIINNNFTDNHHDIAVYANNYRIIGNNLGPERISGNNNIISNNQIVLGEYDTGFWITNSSGTKIESNNITLSRLTTFFISTDNGNFEVFHNNFLNIEEHTGGYLLFLFDYPIPVNVTPPYWDNGYEGNYWSDYSARYPTANEIDNTGIGNTPYVSSTSSKVIDRYPLVTQYNFAKPETPSPSPTSTSFSPDLFLLVVSVVVSVAFVCTVLLVYFKNFKK